MYNFPIGVIINSFRTDTRTAIQKAALGADGIQMYSTKGDNSMRAFRSGGCRWLAGCAVGEGNIPTGECVEILKKAGYDGWLTIEFEGSGDCIEGIAKDLSTLKGYLAE